MKELIAPVGEATVGQGDMVDLRGVIDELVDAYSLQDSNEGAMIAVNGPLIGRKIALNSAALMTQFDLSEPVTARMYKSGLISSGAKLSLSENPNLAIEPELCVTLARDISASEQVSLENVPDLIASVVPAFEVLNRRNMADLMHVPSLVAHNISWAYIVLGTSQGMTDPTQALTVFTKNGQELLNGVGTAPEPYEHAALKVIRNCQSRGISLGQGELILCGTHIAPVDVKAPADFHFQIEGLGEVSLSISD